MKYYRVRTRVQVLGGKTLIVKDKIPTLKQAYEFIIADGKTNHRKYYIDQIEVNLFSKLTVDMAQKRLEEINATNSE